MTDTLSQSDIQINPAYTALVPKPTQEEESAIEHSIKNSGQHYPIIVTRDQKTNKTCILDGYTRYRILKKLGINPKLKYRSFKNSYEEMVFVLESNLHRRHLNAYQKVAAAKHLLELDEKRFNTRDKSVPNGANGKFASKVGKIAGVPTRTVERILYIMEKGDNELNQAVKSGRTKPSYAEKQIRKRLNIVVPTSFPSGKFQVASIDPPWKYDNQIANGPPYQTHMLNEIINFKDKDGKKIPELFTDDCVLYLWTTGPKMEEAFAILRAWKFKFSTIITWVKVKNQKIKFIPGYRAKGAAEYLLIATHGNPETPLPENMPPGVVCAEPKGHSIKPDVFYEIIEKAHPNQKRVDLFARREREGWSIFGNPNEIKQIAS